MAAGARTMTAARVWVEAARPKTLPAAVAPVLVGTAAAQQLILWRCAAALVVALGVQVGVNYANDYFDGVRGIDTPDRVGPRRVVAAGVVTAAQMRLAIAVAIAVAAAAGVALAAVVGWELLLVGLACFAALLGYSGGPRPYASAGLGEVFVFVFFGLVATVGSTYVQDAVIRPTSVLAAVPVGLLATAILMANNLRDIPTDAAAGKRTLAVRLGDRGARVAFAAMVAGAFTMLLPLAWQAGSPLPLVALLALPLAAAPLRLVRAGAAGPPLVGVLAGTARLQLVFAGLLALGLLLR